MTYLDDLQQVRNLIQLYIDGANGDGAKLREAFHPSAHMFGHIGPVDRTMPIEKFISGVEKNPGMCGPNYSAIVRSIDRPDFMIVTL